MDFALLQLESNKQSEAKLAKIKLAADQMQLLRAELDIRKQQAGKLTLDLEAAVASNSQLRLKIDAKQLDLNTVTRKAEEVLCSIRSVVHVVPVVQTELSLLHFSLHCVVFKSPLKYLIAAIVHSLDWLS